MESQIAKCMCVGVYVCLCVCVSVCLWQRPKRTTKDDDEQNTIYLTLNLDFNAINLCLPVHRQEDFLLRFLYNNKAIIRKWREEEFHRRQEEAEITTKRKATKKSIKQRMRAMTRSSMACE